MPAPIAPIGPGKPDPEGVTAKRPASTAAIPTAKPEVVPFCRAVLLPGSESAARSKMQSTESIPHQAAWVSSGVCNKAQKENATGTTSSTAGRPARRNTAAKGNPPQMAHRHFFILKHFFPPAIAKVKTGLADPPFSGEKSRDLPTCANSQAVRDLHGMDAQGTRAHPASVNVPHLVAQADIERQFCQNRHYGKISTPGHTGPGAG